MFLAALNASKVAQLNPGSQVGTLLKKVELLLKCEVEERAWLHDQVLADGFFLPSPPSLRITLHLPRQPGGKKRNITFTRQGSEVS